MIRLSIRSWLLSRQRRSSQQVLVMAIHSSVPAGAILECAGEDGGDTTFFMCLKVAWRYTRRDSR